MWPLSPFWRCRMMPGMSFKVFGALAQKNVNVDIILQSTGRGENKDLIFTVPLADAETAVEVLKENQPRFGGKRSGWKRTLPR